MKQMLPDEVHGRLVAAAAFDGSSDVRRRAIELLVLLRAGIETVGFSRRDVVSRLLHDDTEAVRVSAVTYMAELGVADDLSAVEIARSDSNSDVREGANRARFRILARSSPVEAFEFFRESNRGYESRDLEVRAGEIPTDV